jgi:hypothetical protein
MKIYETEDILVYRNIKESEKEIREVLNDLSMVVVFDSFTNIMNYIKSGNPIISMYIGYYVHHDDLKITDELIKNFIDKMGINEFKLDGVVITGHEEINDSVFVNYVSVYDPIEKTMKYMINA